MIFALICLWLLLGLLGAIIIREEDNGMNLLFFLVFIFAGGITLLVVFAAWLMSIEI